MKHRASYLLAAAAFVSVALSSCSTTKVLAEGERRLMSTKIEVVNNKKYNSSDLVPYLKQKADGWNPFVYVYNWENGENKGWDKFVHRLGKAPVVFDSTLVASSVSNISDHLQYIGYYGSKVEATVDDSKEKKARVRYKVTLGKRYKIKSIAYEIPVSNVGFYKDFYADTTNNTIKVGDYMSEEAMELESARSASVLHNMGYYDFSKNYYFFEADTLSYPDYARLKMIVRSHTRNEDSSVDREMRKYKFGTVSITMPEDVKLREKALRNLNLIKSGEVYSDTKLNTQSSRYSSINYLNSVNIQLDPRPNQDIVDCEIALNKGRTQGFKLGLEASISTTGLWGVSPELSYYHRNIFHGGEILNVSVSTNHQIMNGNSSVKSNEVTVTASLSLPKLFPFPNSWLTGSEIPRSEVKFSYNYQNRPEFIRQMASATFGYTGLHKRRFTYQAYPVSLNLVQLPYIDPAFLESMKTKSSSMLYSFMNHLDLGISSTFQYATGNIANPKETYWYSRLSVDVSGNLLSAFNKFMPYDEKLQARTIFNMPYTQYARMEWSISGTKFFGRNDNHAIAGRFLMGLGYGYGNSLSLPLEKRFYSGGANSLRGWTARTLGPGNAKLDTSWSIPNQNGDMKLEANVEYRAKLFWRISAAVFADMGNIWEVGNPRPGDNPDSYFSFANLGESLAASWGFGIRADFTYLILRIDFGMRVHDPARDKGDRWLGPSRWFQRGNYAFHFGVGYPF